MTSYGLISHRPKEDLILDSIAKVYVSGKIVQYLTCEQIDGLRFLYKNHKNVSQICEIKKNITY